MDKIKVMLISGKVTSEHYYPKANEAIRTMLESTGRFEVKVVEEFNTKDPGWIRLDFSELRRQNGTDGIL